MTTGFIVKDFDVIEHVGTGKISGFIDPLTNSFLFQATKKGFSNSIISTVASSTHTWLKVMRSTEALPIIAAVL